MRQYENGGIVNPCDIITGRHGLGQAMIAVVTNSAPAEIGRLYAIPLCIIIQTNTQREVQPVSQGATPQQIMLTCSEFRKIA